MASVLAPVAVFGSDLPALPAGLLALAASAAALAGWRRERRRTPALLVVPPGAQPVTFDGVEQAEIAFHWRGAWLFVAMRDGQGRRRRRVWWPDTLPPSARRELRLAVRARQVWRPSPPMAP